MKSKRLLALCWFNICVLLMLALHLLFPVKKIIPMPYGYLGILLLLIGPLITVHASNLFKKARTTPGPFEQPSHLVIQGPYRFSRNPMYLGLAIALVGMCFLFGTIMPMMVIPVFVWIVSKYIINVEERALENAFDQTYLEYKRRVRRWI